jgi:hypothetical protein
LGLIVGRKKDRIHACHQPAVIFSGMHRKVVVQTIFIQCCYRQAKLLAERIPSQPAGFEL